MPDRENWSREENELIVADYFEMLADELIGRPYVKSAHNRALQPRLNNRSEPSIEWKKRNISAVLIELGCQYIAGYKPATSIQRSLADVVRSRLELDSGLHEVMAEDADRPVERPQPDDFDVLNMVTLPPERESKGYEAVAESTGRSRKSYVRPNYLERESRNRLLGRAGELLALDFERARLMKAGRHDLVGRIEHVAATRGDGDGFDILSFDENGEERLIEVKTTKYGEYTPFFVSRNELRVSKAESDRYHLYRLFAFSKRPQLFDLRGDIAGVCHLTPTNYQANMR